MKARTISRYFLKGHPRAGEKTFFVEKFLNSVGIDYSGKNYLNVLYELNKKNLENGKLTEDDLCGFYTTLDDKITACKHHTVRGNNHFTAGDMVSIRVWKSKAYNDCQIIIAPPVAVKKTWPFEINATTGDYAVGGMLYNLNDLKVVAANDGFKNTDDLELWFNLKQGEGFSGQIICWNENVEY